MADVTPGATNVSGASKTIKDPAGASEPMGYSEAPSAKAAPVPGPDYGGLARPSGASQVKYGELGQMGPHAVPAQDAGWTSQQMADMNVPVNSTVPYETMSTNQPDGPRKAGYDAMKHKGQG